MTVLSDSWLVLCVVCWQWLANFYQGTGYVTLPEAFVICHTATVSRAPKLCTSFCSAHYQGKFSTP